MLRTRQARSSAWLLGAIAVLANALLLWYFHDRYWYPSDDGFYANIAERLLRGEALHRDVQDIHPGLIHLLHAQAMRLFGVDMVSLRYPLVAMGVLQSIAVFGLLRHVNAAVAALTSVTVTALGMVQFVDPTPNWYALTLACLTAWWLHDGPRGTPWRWIGAGFLVGLTTGLRQLSGVWLAMGVITVAFSEQREPSATVTPMRDTLVARGVLVVMLAATTWYLISSPETEPGGVLLIAIWPIGLLAWSIAQMRVRNATALAICGWLGLGGALPLIPLVTGLVRARALSVWVEDIVAAAVGLTRMSFFGSGWYGLLVIASLYQALTSFTLTLVVNGLYWFVLTIIFLVNGALLVRDAVRPPGSALQPLPVLAAFFAMVALFFEGPLYLYYAVGLVVVALVWRVPRSRWSLAAAGVCVTCLGTTALYFHAGQPRQRTAVEILQGHRVSSAASSDARRAMSRATLRLDASDVAEYERVIAAIQKLAPPDAAIWVLPNDAELYFLAERRNPFRFYNTAFGLRSRDDLAPLIAQLDSHPPPLVIYRPGDKYETGVLSELIEHVRHAMQVAGREGPFELYVPRAD